MTFSDNEIYDAVKNYIPQVSEYVNSHGGGMELLGVKDSIVYITLTGACGGCSMSLMTTKMVVEKKLRELIHPELLVKNVDGTPENIMPDDAYTESEEDDADEIVEEKQGFISSVKHIVGL